MTLKIEAGKRYITRAGDVTTPMQPNDDPLLTWSADCDGPGTWYEDGRYLAAGEASYDLVAEYVEPPAQVESPIPDEILTQTTCPLEMLQDSTPSGDHKTVRLAQFDAEITTVTQRRGAIYGHPRVDFDRAARLKAVVAECADPIARHALEMIAVKMARLITTPDHLDSWVDIAGYARTGVMGTDRD